MEAFYSGCRVRHPGPRSGTGMTAVGNGVILYWMPDSRIGVRDRLVRHDGEGIRYGVNCRMRFAYPAYDATLDRLDEYSAKLPGIAASLRSSR